MSLDNGQLGVSGTVDASGAQVGEIRLAGGRGLSLGGNALLDAHGSLLRRDSYGQIIDSPNRAMVGFEFRQRHLGPGQRRAHRPAPWHRGASGTG